MATQRAGGKSAAAFRTISEVSDELDVPQHVLRFWETKFPQIKPLKRGGGRRYYRPEDVALLRRIRDLLYSDGYTIKGVQRLLRENGGKTAMAVEPGAGSSATSSATPSGGAEQAGQRGDGRGASAKGAGGAPSAQQNEELRRLLAELGELRELLRRSGF